MEPTAPGDAMAGCVSGSLLQRRSAARRLPVALLLAGGVALLAASCARQPATAPAAVPSPALPPVAAPPPVEPPPGGPVNVGLDRLEVAWHLRSALNVAALSCGRQTAGGLIVGHYNQFLKTQNVGLAQAFAAERTQYGPDERAVDTHLTRIYNYFAWPPAQPAFCRMAPEITLQMANISPAQFLDAAPAALARLDTAFIGTPATSAISVAPLPIATTSAKLQPATPAVQAEMALWRVQLGSFSDQGKAQAAWRQVSSHLPAIAHLGPLYQMVATPAPLVRLQGEQQVDKPEAQRLCALAAASGFACLPVAGR